MATSMEFLKGTKDTELFHITLACRWERRQRTEPNDEKNEKKNGKNELILLLCMAYCGIGKWIYCSIRASDCIARHAEVIVSLVPPYTLSVHWVVSRMACEVNSFALM